MSHTVKKSGSISKRIHVHILRGLIWCCLLLLAITVALQVVHLVNPSEQARESEDLLLTDALPFRFTTENIFPFLMLPLLLLLSLFLYLKHFFSINPLSVSSGIRYFRKHRRTIFGRRFCKEFCIVISAISMALTICGFVTHGGGMLFFGFLNVVCTALLHYFACKQLRHSRRQHNGWKKQKAEKQV